MTSLVDSFGRRLDYMRVSVTDRCDLRCIYCASNEMRPLTHNDILRYEEITRVVEAAATLGVTKIRLTGGEPLSRLYLSSLVRMLTAIHGIEEVSLTTNATRLAKFAAELKQAGLKRVNISLDSLQPEKFAQITGSDKLADVLAGIEAANNSGLVPVKINMVVINGVNDNEIPDFVRKTINDGWHVRFIEHMPFENSKTRGNGLVSSESIIKMIKAQFGDLVPHKPEIGNGPASYYRLENTKGTIGFISAVTDCFCEGCNRFRLTADGKLRPCLLDDEEIDIKTALRHGATTEELAEIIKSAAVAKQEKHHLSDGSMPAGRSMRQIGG